MKHFLLIVTLLFCDHTGFGQAYIPMPADSAVWRYRSFNDIGTMVIDQVLFVNGTDTIAHGNTYHKIMTRSFIQTGPAGFSPPVVTVEANTPDTYYGAMRESGKQVFLLSASGEHPMFDFNAGVGDSIPAYLAKVKVTGIDSVLLGGTYHKRYLTTDPGYYVIEGVGSSRGLIPDLNDGGADIIFYCFTLSPVTWSPDGAIPCTEVFAAGHSAGLNRVYSSSEISIYPNPAGDAVHIGIPVPDALYAVIVNGIGGVMWKGSLMSNTFISVAAWPRGIYFAWIQSEEGQIVTKKFILK
jgi:Secretion system C-terminal sorting domain